MDQAFKCCGKCCKTWHRREDLVRDPELVLIGYQPTFGKPAEGLLLFTHMTPHCGSTLAVLVGDFADYVVDRPTTIQPIGTLVCPSHCLRVHDLQACQAPCGMGWIRQLILMLRRHEVPATNRLASTVTQRVRRIA